VASEVKGEHMAAVDLEAVPPALTQEPLRKRWAEDMEAAVV